MDGTTSNSELEMNYADKGQLICENLFENALLFIESEYLTSRWFWFFFLSTNSLCKSYYIWILCWISVIFQEHVA